MSKLTTNKKTLKKKRFHKRVRQNTNRPRLVVFRSNKNISAQVVDNVGQKVITSASSVNIKSKKKATKTDIAQEVGKLVAQKTLKKDIKKVAFDRGNYKYHGRIKALAEAARKEGLDF